MSDQQMNIIWYNYNRSRKYLFSETRNIFRKTERSVRRVIFAIETGYSTFKTVLDYLEESNQNHNHPKDSRGETSIQCGRGHLPVQDFGHGKGDVTGFTDDRLRYRIMSKAYLNKSKKESVNALHHALKKGRVPRQIYLDNGRQFTAKEFREELTKNNIRAICGKPYHPRGRGKIEGYHKVLYRELITQVRFSSLSHFRKELRKFDRKYNHWRKQQVHGWKTPASICHDRRYFNKK